ncbi:MAG: YjgN family protein [Arenicella sp.]
MQALSFEGKGFEYFKIWIVNILLTIVTLGLYYPWAKVRNRRYFYANSTLEGKSFDYHATGKQLFIGYLISMALLIAYVALQKVSPAISGVIVLVFLAALPWIIWRSLKFNMRVTSFSNVLFSFDGKLGGSYFNYMLMPFLFMLSLYIGPILIAVIGSKLVEQFSVVGGVFIAAGVIASLALAVYVFAVMKKKNAMYVINGTRYGQGQFKAELEVAPFAKIFLKSIALFLLAGFAYMIVIAIVGFAFGAANDLLGVAANLDDPVAIQGVFENALTFVLIGLVYLGFIFISIAVFSYSYVRQREYIYNNVVLDDKIAFSSQLTVGRLAWVSLSNLLMTIVTLGLAMPWAAVRMARLVLEHTSVDTSAGIDSYVTQQQKDQSSLGEQIGDAFDVEVGVGF